MALARFKDLCLDAGDLARVGEFWAQVLDRSWQPDDDGDGLLRGPTPRHTIWINRVPEPKAVKYRVHFDIYANRLADLEVLGSPVILPEGDDRRWTVMADPEGGEYCAFLRDELPADRLHGLVVDSADPAAQAEWWGRVYGAAVVHDPRGHSTVEKVPGMPILTMDFDPVPEPKTAKNRLHLDVNPSGCDQSEELERLTALGARRVDVGQGETPWIVVADPEDNEFCLLGRRIDP